MRHAVIGTARLCSDCAGRTPQPVADSHCPVCSQTTLPGKSCANRLCALPVHQQGWPCTPEPCATRSTS
ncbi:hypothetical protein OG404_33205 [Streptomyces griseoaurantiacus]|uniref:hypothetical protein n=1 Tax=Streptomyces griseoaurantiacus TaxID=68213 RepID=UPI00352D6199